MEPDAHCQEEHSVSSPCEPSASNKLVVRAFYQRFRRWRQQRIIDEKGFVEDHELARMQRQGDLRRMASEKRLTLVKEYFKLNPVPPRPVPRRLVPTVLARPVPQRPWGGTGWDRMGRTAANRTGRGGTGRGCPAPPCAVPSFPVLSLPDTSFPNVHANSPLAGGPDLAQNPGPKIDPESGSQFKTLFIQAQNLGTILGEKASPPLHYSLPQICLSVENVSKMVPVFRRLA